MFRNIKEEQKKEKERRRELAQEDRRQKSDSVFKKMYKRISVVPAVTQPLVVYQTQPEGTDRVVTLIGLDFNVSELWHAACDVPI